MNLYAPPADPGTDPDAIVKELVKFRDAKNIPAGELIHGGVLNSLALKKYGYSAATNVHVPAEDLTSNSIAVCQSDHVLKD